jgi:collagen type III alpha
MEEALMTSEGQYAGSQPAEATSGDSSPDGFPPDTEGHRVSGRASAPSSADSFPNSYAPPPHHTPNGGSPFVVPTVASFGQGQESRGTSYGSARVPQPEESDALPQRNSASPYGAVTPGDATGDPAWAPLAARPTDPPAQFAGSSDPLPQRNPSPVDPAGPLDGFDGFAAGTPGRGTPPPAPEPETPTGRPPGLSAFGDQRVRVPGASLTGLPDAPPPARMPSGGFPVRSETPADGSGFPLRGGGNGTFPTRGSSGGFPLRGAAGSEPEAAGQPGGDLPIRSQQSPYSADPDGASGSFNAFAQPPADEVPPHPYGRPAAEPFGDPFGRAPGEPPAGQSGDSSQGGLPDPFGRTPGEPFGAAPGQPTSGSASVYGSARPASAGPAFDAPQPPFPADQSAPPPFPGGQGDQQQFDVQSQFGNQPPFDAQPHGDAQPPFGGQTPFGAQPPFGAPPQFGGDQPQFGSDQQGQSPFGEQPAFGSAQPRQSPFGAAPIPGQSSPQGEGFAPGEADDEHAQFRRPDYPQRVPGAALGTGGEPRGSAVPQPRDPAEMPPAAAHSAPPMQASGAPAQPGPAVGSARPVTASASVPTTNRAQVDATEIPPPATAPQARVYGRPASAEPEGHLAGDNDSHEPPSGAPAALAPPAPQYGSPFGARPDEDGGSPLGAHGDSPFEPHQDGSPYGNHPDSPFGNHPDSPFGTPDDQQRPPFGARPGDNSGSPFGQGPEENGGSPYGQRPDENGGSPFGQRPDDGSPSGQREGSPFGQHEDSPFGQRPEEHTGSPFDNQPGPFGARPDGAGPFGARPGEGSTPYGQKPGDHDAQGDQPGVAPQSPARATARASASARVAPPGPQQAGPPHSEFVDRAPEFSELTTDIAHRGPDAAYVPAPALPAMPPGLEGGFTPPGSPVNRATVTPPGPEDTTSWPGPEQDGFEQFKAEPEPPKKPETPHVRMFPILIAVVAGAALLLAIVFGIVFLAAGGKDEPQSIKQGECVKQEGTNAVKVDCGDAASFQVVSIVDDKSKCDDPKQPVVVTKSDDGKSQVLCLKPKA